MANVYADDYKAAPLHMREFGNAWAKDYQIAKAAGIADKLYFGVIPAGVRVDSVSVIFDDCGTGGTFALGYEPDEGATPAAALTYWFATQDTDTAAGRAASIAKPIMFDKPVRLVGTRNTAAHTGTPSLIVVVHGQTIGQA